MEKIEVFDNGNVFCCDSNIRHLEYMRLRDEPDTKEMSDAKVIKYAADRFGFDPTKIKPLHDLPVRVFVGSHGSSATGGKIRRHALYNATDWNYMLFEVCGTKWEVINGDLEAVME